MNLLQFRIGTRMTLVFGLVITVFLAMAGVAYARIAALNAEIASVIGGRYQNTVLANQLKSEVAELSRSMMNVLVMTDETQTKKELGAIDTQFKAHAATLASLAGRIADEAGLTSLKEITALRDKFSPALGSFVKLVSEGNKDDALVRYLFSVRSVQTKYIAALDSFVSSQHAQMVAAGAASAEQAARTAWLIAGLAGAATLASAVMGLIATRSITRPLRRAVDVAKRVAAGDLGSRIESRTRDETGELMAALRDMNDSLRSIVGNVRGGTESIAAASAEIASGNQDLSSRTEDQASSLEHTTRAMRDLTTPYGPTPSTPARPANWRLRPAAWQLRAAAWCRRSC